MWHTEEPSPISTTTRSLYFSLVGINRSSQISCTLLYSFCLGLSGPCPHVSFVNLPRSHTLGIFTETSSQKLFFKKKKQHEIQVQFIVHGSQEERSDFSSQNMSEPAGEVLLAQEYD